MTWPRAAIVRQADLTHQPAVAKVKMPQREAEILPQDESMGLIQDTCLLIACHKSTLSKERYDTFCDTLRSALDLFPPNAIFVCDNAPLQHPCDRTQEVCKKVSLERYPSGGEGQQIQYLYIPEGNKSHAMYVVNPFQSKIFEFLFFISSSRNSKNKRRQVLDNRTLDSTSREKWQVS